MILVLNEWLFEDLLGRNGSNKQEETRRFLLALEASEDKFVIPSKKRWNDKGYSLMTQRDIRLQGISKLFNSLRLNSDKAVVQVTTPEIPEALLDQLPSEDVYLVSAYLSAGADLLVTTDRGLFDSLVGSDFVLCQMRDEFLSGYLS
ncbi:MAG: hypothetical protein OXC95_06815 [Dehalococcoidia bacterium]|nr:hypothetical protein [Dehalococcoidia bacterium]